MTDPITEKPSTVEVTEAKESQAPSQVQRTEREKAEFTLKKNAERLTELGGNPTEILGGKAESEDEDEGEDVPAWFKKHQASQVKKTALELADAISDETEKKQVKDLLNNRIIPSGKADEDFRMALGMVKAPKNKEIVEELRRYTAPSQTAMGSSMPPKYEVEFTPTPAEAQFMAPPYNTPKEKILEARKREAEKRQ